MIHIFILIYCCDFYFNLIVYIEFQLLIRFYSIYFCLQLEIHYYICSLFHLLNLSPHCFIYLSYQGKFFSLQGQWTLFTVTTVDDCLFCGFNQFSPCLRVWPLVRIAVTIGNSIPNLCIITIRQGAGVVEDNEEANLNGNAWTEPVTPLVVEEEDDPKKNSLMPPPGTWKVPKTRWQRRNHRHQEQTRCPPSSPLPLVWGDGFGDTVDVRRLGRSKVKSSDPPRLGRCQNRATEEKPPSSYF